jgi:hypothetical protein
LRLNLVPLHLFKGDQDRARALAALAAGILKATEFRAAMTAMYGAGAQQVFAAIGALLK